MGLQLLIIAKSNFRLVIANHAADGFFVNGTAPAGVLAAHIHACGALGADAASAVPRGAGSAAVGAEARDANSRTPLTTRSGVLEFGAHDVPGPIFIAARIAVG